MARRRVSAGVASLLTVAVFAAVSAASCADPQTAVLPVPEREAVTWRPWVIDRVDVLRPAPPPAAGSAQEVAERDAVVALQRTRSAATDSLVRRYDGDPTAFWTAQAIDLLGFYWPLLPDVRVATPARSARLMALLHVAMYDAILATWDAKWAYARLTPSRASTAVRALVTTGEIPSYPSEHAAVAAAASTVLAALLLPGDTLRLRALADEAGLSRVMAGAAYPNDVSAGRALGTAVARRVLALAAIDGSDALWTGRVPDGASFWKPTPVRYVQSPFDPLAGRWRPWVIASGDAYRPPPPPALGSPAFERDLTELRTLASDGAGGRTLAQIDAARYWATEAPTARWELFMQEELAKRRLSTPGAARARAYLSVAMYDAFVACWDAKFFYWLARPVTIDPALRTVFSTPPFPSYPSGHSTVSTAAAQVMGALFPDASDTFTRRAVEASNSRVWAGVHYRFDIEAGDTLGTKVGKAVTVRLRSDGAR